MLLNDLEKRACDAIALRANELLAQLAEHVAIPTGRGFKPGLDRYREMLCGRLAKLGAQREEIAGDERPAWLTLPGAKDDDGSSADLPPTILMKRREAASRGEPRILLAGHLDTVHDPDGSFNRLTISSDGRTATGPGAADMKGGNLIAIAALEALHANGFAPAHWTFLLNSDEETGSFHSLRAIREAAAEHDIGLAMEPALPDGSLVTERMGSGQFKIEVHGRGAHVGRDFARGVSAVTALGRVLVRLAEMARPAEGLIVNAGPLLGGSVTNAVPHYAACWGNVRFDDEPRRQRLEREFEALATAADAMPRILVHRDFNRPAKPATPAVMQLAEAARRAARDLGQPLPFARTGGVCDGNIMQAAGLPTIDTLGVRGGNLHRDDEFIEIASLVERAQLMAVLLMRLSSSA